MLKALFGVSVFSFVTVGVVGVALPTHLADRQGCKEFINKLSSSYTYGWVNSSEEPGNKNSANLKVFYYYKTSLEGRPVLFLNGGPGADSHDLHDSLEDSLKSFGLEKRISFIYMDQRGTGCSSAYPETKSDNENMERSKWYGSRGIVSDSETIRQKILANQKWSVFGHSYGALVAHHYLTLFPESLERVFAYANVITPDPMVRVTNRIAAEVKTWEDYFSTYPEDRPRLTKILETMQYSVCKSSSSGDKLCGYEFIDPLSSGAIGFLNLWDWMHPLFQSMVPNDTVEKNKVTAFGMEYAGTPEHSSTLTFETIDYYDRDVLPFDYSHCREISEQLSNVRLENYLTECSAPLQSQKSDPEFEQVQNHFGEHTDHLNLQDFRTALQQNRSVSFFLYSGEWDPYVPTASFSDEIRETQGLITYRNFSKTAHEGYLTQKQVFLDMVGD